MILHTPRIQLYKQLQREMMWFCIDHVRWGKCDIKKLKKKKYDLTFDKLCKSN